jgi:nitrate reductase gamma subunit
MSLLHIAEIVHWFALAFMLAVYAARIVWLLKRPDGIDRQAKGERAADNGAMLGALYSLGNIAMPWAMESTRKGFGFYLSFAFFHIGVTAGIWLAFMNWLDVIHATPVFGYIFMGLIGLAFLISLGRIVRRFALPYLRLISTPDDYFALFTLTVWFAFGVCAQAHLIAPQVDALSMFAGDGWLAAYLLCTSFFLVYVPFSKISHYLYYPFTRFWLGRTLGHRGSIGAARVRA